MARPPAHTKIGPKRIHVVRCRGGNLKFRAMRLDNGNFSWGSEAVSRKTRILDVVYNASNNELVRTKTLVKNAIVTVRSTRRTSLARSSFFRAMKRNDSHEVFPDFFFMIPILDYNSLSTLQIPCLSLSLWRYQHVLTRIRKKTGRCRSVQSLVPDSLRCYPWKEER